MANSVELSNGRIWKSQKAANEHFRSIRDRYADGVPINDDVDHNDLISLLERYDAAHPEEESKIGRGVDYFEVRTNYGSGGQTRGFWVVRTDASATDFSFPWAVRGVPKPQSQEFADACRAAVLADLRAAKRKFFSTYADSGGCVPCELTGRPLTIDEAQVDHVHPPFGALVITFRAERGWHLRIPDDILSKPADDQLTSTFVDPDLVMAFRTYHYRAATLRIISKFENLSRAAGQRHPRIKRSVVLLDPDRFAL